MVGLPAATDDVRRSSSSPRGHLPCLMSPARWLFHHLTLGQPAPRRSDTIRRCGGMACWRGEVHAKVAGESVFARRMGWARPLERAGSIEADEAMSL